MSETTADETESTYSHSGSDRDTDVLRRVQPTIKPVLIRLALTVLVSVIAIGVLFSSPTLLGSRDLTNVALLVVQLLALIAVVRLVVQLLVLRRTEYVIRPESVKRSYELFLRSNEREVPFELVRSHEFNQSRTENLLGHGTITLNQGLGDLKLRNIPEPDEVYGVIRNQAESN